MSLALTLRDFASVRGLRFAEHPPDNGVVRVSIYSQDETKRYAYLHLWQATKPIILWIMLNPGTGDTELRRRNTLERCKQWSQGWGYGGLLIGNLLTTRTKSAKELGQPSDHNDPANDEALRFLRVQASAVMVAWGNKGRTRQLSPQFLPLLDGAKCFGLTAKGEPRHPLYVAKEAVPVAWAYSQSLVAPFTLVR